jgi:hypothetical protein
MNALESVVESSVNPAEVTTACRSAFVSGGPAQFEVRWPVRTAVSSRFGRLIAAVSALESADVTDKWAARLDCVPARRGFPPRTQAHRVWVQWRQRICGGYAGRKLPTRDICPRRDTNACRRLQLSIRPGQLCAAGSKSGSVPRPDAYRPVWISAIALSIASSMVRRI